MGKGLDLAPLDLFRNWSGLSALFVVGAVTAYYCSRRKPYFHLVLSLWNSFFTTFVSWANLANQIYVWNSSDKGITEFFTLRGPHYISTAFLLGYFLLDTIIGFKDYPNETKAVTGCFHHVIFFVILGWLKYKESFPLMSNLGGLYETSVLYYNLMLIFPKLKNQVVFGSIFVLARVLVTIFMITVVVVQKPDFWVLIATMMALFIVGNIYWFLSWSRLDLASPYPPHSLRKSVPHVNHPLDV